jgi:hypothetical protein
MQESDAVWAETTDGGMLRQLFGYYPTLHDAVIRVLRYERAGDRLVMEVVYTDLAQGETDEQNLTVAMELVWEGLKEAKLRLDANDLTGMDLRRAGDHIRTDFELSFGTHGHVVSERFEVRLRQVEPPKDEYEADDLTFHLT